MPFSKTVLPKSGCKPKLNLSHLKIEIQPLSFALQKHDWKLQMLTSYETTTNCGWSSNSQCICLLRRYSPPAYLWRHNYNWLWWSTKRVETKSQNGTKNLTKKKASMPATVAAYEFSLVSVPTRQSLALWRPCRCQKVAWRQRHRQSHPTLGSPKGLQNAI